MLELKQMLSRSDQTKPLRPEALHSLSARVFIFSLGSLVFTAVFFVQLVIEQITHASVFGASTQNTPDSVNTAVFALMAFVPNMALLLRQRKSRGYQVTTIANISFVLLVMGTLLVSIYAVYSYAKYFKWFW